MKLHFSKSHLLRIIQTVKAGSSHHVPYTGGDWGCPEKTTPGLILVGDQGIYIIGNHKHDKSPTDDGLVAYAKECDPHHVEDWYDIKRATFGGNDGCIFLPQEEAENWLAKGDAPSLYFTTDAVQLYNG